jgi:hypothetical protein
MNVTTARALSCAGLILLAGCGNSTPPTKDPAPADAATSTPAPAPTASATAPQDAGAPAADASAPADAGSAPAASDAGADSADAGAPFAADNKVAPTEGPELQARAKGLFEAIVKDEPSLAEPFWFPKEPFIPLKDVKDPGKYWDQLHRTYVNDVHALHKKRKDWDKATFAGFDGWSRSKWVPPGDEANKIGYHRAFHGKLRYEIDGKKHELDVHTIITWQGRWYITHLRKFKK